MGDVAEGVAEPGDAESANVTVVLVVPFRRAPPVRTYKSKPAVDEMRWIRIA